MEFAESKELLHLFCKVCGLHEDSVVNEASAQAFVEDLKAPVFLFFSKILEGKKGYWEERAKETKEGLRASDALSQPVGLS